MLFERACPLIDKECRQQRCAWFTGWECAIWWLGRMAEERSLEIERQELHQQQRSRIDAPLSDEE